MPPSARDAQTEPESRRRDLELARAAAAGEPAAQREVTRRLYDRVLNTVRYLRGDRPDTPDLVQSCLVELLRALGGFRGESRLETWADRIAVRTIMRELRRQKRRREVSDERAVDRPDLGEDPEKALGQDRLRGQVAGMLQKLSPDRRLVMVLRAVYGYTMPEIAELIDTRLHNVQNDYRAARKQLRRLVESDGVLREWARERRP
jgi:RNA polymerase sigma-70 factor (ECF subfamily)